MLIFFSYLIKASYILEVPFVKNVVCANQHVCVPHLMNTFLSASEQLLVWSTIYGGSWVHLSPGILTAKHVDWAHKMLTIIPDTWKGHLKGQILLLFSLNQTWSENLIHKPVDKGVNFGKLCCIIGYLLEKKWIPTSNDNHICLC